MKGFYKTRECPASEDILAALEPENGRDEVSRHLAECEFCTAESELYRLYPMEEENVVVGRMPEPLRDLALALLQRKCDLTQLYKLMDV